MSCDVCTVVLHKVVKCDGHGKKPAANGILGYLETPFWESKVPFHDIMTCVRASCVFQNLLFEIKHFEITGMRISSNLQILNIS